MMDKRDIPLRRGYINMARILPTYVLITIHSAVRRNATSMTKFFIDIRFDHEQNFIEEIICR